MKISVLSYNVFFPCQSQLQGVKSVITVTSLLETSFSKTVPYRNYGLNFQVVLSHIIIYSLQNKQRTVPWSDS